MRIFACKYCLILVLFSVFLLSACSKGDSAAEKRSERAEKAKNDIIIGAAGPWAEKRNLLEQGMNLAVDKINDSGGLLNGRKIKLRWGDDQRSVEQGLIVAQMFADDPDTVAVIGHSSSSISVPASIIYQYNGLVMLSPLSTSTRLTAQNYPLIFRNIPSDATFGVKAAEYCKAHGLERVMIYHVRDEFGQGQSNAFEMKAGELGLNIPDRASYDSSSTPAQIAQDMGYWKDSYDFDAIFLAGLMPKAAEVIIEIRKAGIDLPIVGGDALDHPMLAEMAGESADNVYAASVFDVNAENINSVKFTKEFRSVYGKEPDIAAAQGYDAVNVLAHAITQAGSSSPDKIAAALHDLQNYQGLTGGYSFDEKGDVSGRKVIVKKMMNRRFEIVK